MTNQLKHEANGLSRGLKNGFKHHEVKQEIKKPREIKEEFEETPLIIALSVYFCYLVLTFFGHIRDFVRRLGFGKIYEVKEKNREGYVKLYRSFESFYTRNIYKRIVQGWNMFVCGVPGVIFKLKIKISPDFHQNAKFGTEKNLEAINLGSYNYLGFAENSGKCADSVEQVILKYGTGICSTRHELGHLDIHRKLETMVAEFLGVEDSIIVGMGFATNSTNIPTLMSKGCLIFSDELNHASLVLGCRLSGAKIVVYKHNNMKDLEEKVKEAIIEGQPHSHRPWRKMLIIVEGVYSMEGTIVNLPGLIAIKKKYKCYLYVDEAHSIGAIGSCGRGVTDYFDCNPKDVDLLMGTFTKSFGASGGYIAGSKRLINHLRSHSHSFSYATSMSAPVAQQIIMTLKILTGKDGSNEGINRVKHLERNTHYFRRKLKQKGFIIYGNEDSPVVPLMLFFPSKVTEFIQGLLMQGVATVGVCYPATTVVTSRARFCISASHTKEMLDKALTVIDTVGQRIMVNYSKKQRSQEEVIY
ncbi:serine palmitoyltransferase 2-like isoform X2 [Stegodyphus dumicola]|uniref:serine palmitoyltransferase 2-like isoform X2 n=1 Tax=Stegodyphus dumicola TaxID=202533 RepID=UPI0015A7A4B8|nr:serine palmitoyltransferase 2-like isoform X2 [Stegodyphus dumicola]